MQSQIFTVTPDTSLTALRQAVAADSTFEQITFEAGVHQFSGTVVVAKPDMVIRLQQDAVLSPTHDVARLFDVRASGVSVVGTGRFDGATQFDNPAFRQFIYVRDTADGFHASGTTKPTQSNQYGALEFTKSRVAIEVNGADNVILENLYLNNFRPGAYGLILRDVATQDGVNARGDTGSHVQNLFADGASGGGLPEEHHVNGSWIRLDTSANGDPVNGAQLKDVSITDNILLGGAAGYDADGRTYYFVNIDSNIEAASGIEIAYNTLSDAVSYEIQIKNGYDSPFGILDVVVHDNIMDHASDALLRRWPLKLQSNFESPLDVTFQNNLAFMRDGTDVESLHLSVGFVDNIAFNGDFVTDQARTVLRSLGDDHLVATTGDDWIITGGAKTVTTGEGADLIDFRRGDGAVIISDFELGTDTLRLVDFGPSLVPQLLSSPIAGEGMLRWGQDVLILENGGEAVDLSQLNYSDVVFDDTRNTVFADPSDPVVAGTGFADRMMGSETADNMVGGAGADQIDGASGHDWLYGDEGDDRIAPGQGTDRMWGGTGHDVFVFGPSDGLNIVYDFQIGQDKIALRDVSFADLSMSVYNGKDADIRTAAGDRLVLRDITPDQLDGLDFLMSGQDTTGAVAGGAGPDNLHGTNRADVLMTTPGIDRFYGYAGADTFVLDVGVGLNVVYDFEVGHDRIGLIGHSYADLSIFMYNNNDAEIRSSAGDRLVLRNVDINELSPADFQTYSPASLDAA